MIDVFTGDDAHVARTSTGKVVVRLSHWPGNTGVVLYLSPDEADRLAEQLRAQAERVRSEQS